MDRFKFPRIFHFPWSESVTSDDVWMDGCDHFGGKEVVVSEKMDGECTTIYSDGYVHARSLNTSPHASRSWVKQLASQVAYKLPANYRLCGENLFAYHSIFYTELPTYFFVFAIFDENNYCLSWDETEKLCKELDLTTVPVIYRGVWSEEYIRSLWQGKGSHPTFVDSGQEPCQAEGYVVRLAEEFSYDDYNKCTGKMVRANHVQTDQQWMFRSVVPNLLRS